ncbi:MAG: glycosyltransferase family 2 protein [Hominenteromicrobium sp.]
MENIKISVIMPVYNVEKYVGRAIESIQKQTLRDFEFLIVDDGTKDSSGVICDQYAEKDARIRVFHKENGGAPSARNMAIDRAKGKYMYFMDSDDWAEETMLEDMYRLAEQCSAELVVSGFYIDTFYSDTEFVSEKRSQPDCVYPSQQAFRENAYKLFDCNLLYTPWNKLYLSAYIQKYNLRFPQTFWDDFPFNLSVVRDVEKVAVTSKCYYHFIRARAESETAKYRSDMYQKREEEHDWMLRMYQYWNVSDADSMEMIQRRYIERVVGCVENLTNAGCRLSAKEKKQEIRKMIGSPRVREALRIAKPRSVMMKLALLPIRWRWTWLVYQEGCYISKVKASNTKKFAELKASR